MIPALPVGLLEPLAWGTALLCAAMIAAILLRRVWILWRGRVEDALAERVETLLLRFITGELPPAALERSLARPDRKRIQALVRAVVRVETAGHADLRDRLRAAGLPRALAAAVEPRGRLGGLGKDRWTRAAAARALGALGLAEGLPALERALDDDDPEVAYAAAGALAALEIPEAAAAIGRRIGKGTRLNNARLAAHLETMRCEIAPVLRDLLERDDPVAAFFALGLVGEKRAYDLVEEVRGFLASADANVRAAAAECLGRLRVPLTDRWLEPLLEDAAWFVRCHAAKALGDLGAAWAAPAIARFLEDREWWVRTNGAEALVAIGRSGEAGRAEAVAAAEDVLMTSGDRFARNTAVDVLERLGWLETSLGRAAAGDRRARAALEVLALSGGVGHLENALSTAPEAALPVLLDLLADLGDDATYGRIRAAMTRIPEALRPRALEVAAALRSA